MVALPVSLDMAFLLYRHNLTIETGQHGKSETLVPDGGEWAGSGGGHGRHIGTKGDGIVRCDGTSVVIEILEVSLPR
jgi:hypothetical protein